MARRMSTSSEVQHPERPAALKTGFRVQAKKAPYNPYTVLLSFDLCQQQASATG